MQVSIGEEEFNRTIQGIFAEWINHGNDAQAVGDKVASWQSLKPKCTLNKKIDAEVLKHAKATMSAMTKETDGFSALLKDKVQESALVKAGSSGPRACPGAPSHGPRRTPGTRR